MKLLRELASELFDLLLPPACAGCRRAPRPGRALCARCDAVLPRLSERPPLPRPLTDCVAAMAYEGAAESWLRRFKYPPAGLAGLAPGPEAVVREWIREAGARAGPPPDLVVPVPLHRRRLRSRGFNPAALLARALARTHGAPWAPVALARLRDTPSQTGLDRRARARNVRNAFAARRPLPARIWLVDDVTTTGATLAAAARALRRAGARHVVGVCAAFTPF